MAADTISSLGGWTVSAALQAAIIIDRKGKPGLISTVTNIGDCSGRGSLSIQVGTYDAGADAFAAHSEAGSITPDSLADGSVTPVLAEQVLDHKLSDEALFVLDGANWTDFMQQRVDLFADQADDRLSALVCSVYDDFTDVTGTAGDQLTVDDIFTARAFMTALDSGSGPVYCVIHPVQGAQLALSMRAEGMIQFTMDPVMSGMFRVGGTVKGVLMNDVVVVETSHVATVSSNYRGAMYRKDAIVYGHGIPQGLSTWSQNARRLAVTPGDVAAFVASRGADLAPEVNNVLGQLANGSLIPEIYVEMGREGSLSTREASLHGSFFAGVIQRSARGTGLRSAV